MSRPSDVRGRRAARAVPHQRRTTWETRGVKHFTPAGFRISAQCISTCRVSARLPGSDPSLLSVSAEEHDVNELLNELRPMLPKFADREGAVPDAFPEANIADLYALGVPGAPFARGLAGRASLPEQPH